MDRREAERAYLTLQSHQSQLAALEEQRASVAAALDELDRAHATLEAIQGAPAGEEILVPVGAGTFIRAAVTDVREVISGIGAGVSVDDTNERARARLDERRKALEATEKRMADRSRELVDEMVRLQAMLEGAADAEE